MKVPGHTATLHFAAGCAMTFVLLLPLKANAPDSTARPRTALRCVRKAPMTRRHPRLLRRRRVPPLVASRTTLRRLPLPSSVFLSSLAEAIGMRGQSLRHTHPSAVSGARFTLAWQAAPTPPATVAPTPRGEKCSASLTSRLTVTSHRQIQLAPQAARAGKPHVPTPLR